MNVDIYTNTQCVALGRVLTLPFITVTGNRELCKNDVA